MSVLISQWQHLYMGAACFYWLKAAASSIFLLVEKFRRHLSTGGIILLLQRNQILLFLGEGQFGKVYTAVNNDTGDLMAMKEVNISIT